MFRVEFDLFDMFGVEFKLFDTFRVEFELSIVKRIKLWVIWWVSVIFLIFLNLLIVVGKTLFVSIYQFWVWGEAF